MVQSDLAARCPFSRLLGFAAVVLSVCSLTIQAEPVTRTATLDEEIKGFVIDYTITGVGHEFSRYLSQYRAVNFPDAEYNLTIKERPSARWGSLIWVESQHREYFRSFVQPGRNSLKSLAEQAAQQIEQRIQQHKIQSVFADTFDMEKDEL